MNAESENPDRTPFYQAIHSDRYARQEAIKSLQENTGRKLIVYEANILSERAALGEEDIQPFCDLLNKIEKGKDIDLLLHSPGGDIDAAEKIVYMCRKTGGSFRAIVPEYAKSAATLIALAGDSIVMGIASEIGPIDPQVLGPGPGGVRFQTSAQSFIDEFERIKKEVEETGELSPAYFPSLDGINLGFIGMLRNSIARSRTFAEKILTDYMMKNDSKQAKETAENLCDVKKWLSHGKVIDSEEAKELKINVEYLEPTDALWKKLWYLHCCYGVLFREEGVSKVYESEFVSLPFK